MAVSISPGAVVLRLAVRTAALATIITVAAFASAAPFGGSLAFLYAPAANVAVAVARSDDPRPEYLLAVLIENLVVALGIAAVWGVVEYISAKLRSRIHDVGDSSQTPA